MKSSRAWDFEIATRLAAKRVEYVERYSQCQTPTTFRMPCECVYGATFRDLRAMALSGDRTALENAMFRANERSLSIAGTVPS